jgi:uncharacterized membrane protein YsdA (DUF1294 family)
MTSIMSVYLAMSVVTFCVYAADKSAAISNSWRISEKTLLGLGLACGWPGGFIAQRLLKHKSNKKQFLAWFWFSVVLNVTACLALTVR